MDDKKKIVVVGALFVAMLAIGAFQLTKGGDEPAKPAEAAKAVANAEGSTTKAPDGTVVEDEKKDEKAKNPLVSLPLTPRDPFKPLSMPNPTPSPATTAPAPKPIATPPQPAPRQQRGFDRSIPPVQIEGQFPGTLPGPNDPISGPVGAPTAGPAPVSSFGYTLKGTLMGDRPMAVFADAQGNERIVPVGSSLDGDNKVVSVQPGAVKVRSHGKTTTMTPGGKE